jgi:hypothetical protein
MIIQNIPILFKAIFLKILHNLRLVYLKPNIFIRIKESKKGFVLGAVNLTL